MDSEMDFLSTLLPAVPSLELDPTSQYQNVTLLQGTFIGALLTASTVTRNVAGGAAAAAVAGGLGLGGLGAAGIAPVLGGLGLVGAAGVGLMSDGHQSDSLSVADQCSVWLPLASPASSD